MSSSWVCFAGDVDAARGIRDTDEAAEHFSIHNLATTDTWDPTLTRLRRRFIGKKRHPTVRRATGMVRWRSTMLPSRRPIRGKQRPLHQATPLSKLRQDKRAMADLLALAAAPTAS